MKYLILFLASIFPPFITHAQMGVIKFKLTRHNIIEISSIINEDFNDTFKLHIDNNIGFPIINNNFRTRRLFDESINKIKLPLVTLNGMKWHYLYNNNIRIRSGACVANPSSYYKIDASIQNDSEASDGTIGIQDFRGDAQMIDFFNNEITIINNPNSIDSFIKLFNLCQMPAEFSGSKSRPNVRIDISINNKAVKNIKVDLGYNGCVLLRKNIYKSIPRSELSLVTNVISRTASKATTKKERYLADAQVRLNDSVLNSIVVFESEISEKVGLVGIVYLQQYEKILFDYKNRKLYCLVRNPLKPIQLISRE